MAVRSLSLLKTTPNSQQPALTPREISVLTYRREGKTYKEIAALLDISVRTVQFHVQSILQKTNTHSSAEAVYYFSERRPIPVHPASYHTAAVSHTLTHGHPS